MSHSEVHGCPSHPPYSAYIGKPALTLNLFLRAQNPNHDMESEHAPNHRTELHQKRCHPFGHYTTSDGDPHVTQGFLFDTSE
jgi:hypothetical protein